jgi:type IV pilus assembly protein PilW
MTANSLFQQYRPRQRQGGLSLIEMMVSLTLGLMILSGVLVVFANSSAARSEVERTSRQIENGRYASDLLSDDIRLAGFYGEYNIALLAAPGALADPCALTVAAWTSTLPVAVQGYDENGFVSANCSLTNRKANTDVLVVRRTRACTDGVAGCTAAGLPFFQASLCATEVATPYKLDLSTAAFGLRKKNCTTSADKREYYVHIYFISTDNGAGQAIPTLKRLEMTSDLTKCQVAPPAGVNVCWTEVPLVEGIEEFQLQYGLDTDGDGNPDALDSDGDGTADGVYIANPNTYPIAAPTPVASWMNVVTVRFNILARNLEASTNYLDTKTYSLGIDAAGAAITVGPKGDAFRRHVYSGLVRVANVAGRRDTP